MSTLPEIVYQTSRNVFTFGVLTADEQANSDSNARALVDCFDFLYWFVLRALTEDPTSLLWLCMHRACQIKAKRLGHSAAIFGFEICSLVGHPAFVIPVIVSIFFACLCFVLQREIQKVSQLFSQCNNSAKQLRQMFFSGLSSEVIHAIPNQEGVTSCTEYTHH